MRCCLFKNLSERFRTESPPRRGRLVSHFFGQGWYSLYRHSPQAGTPQQVRTHSKGYWAKTETGWGPTKARGIANPPNIKKLKTLVVSLFCHKASEYNRLKYLKPELGLWLSLAKLIRLWNWLMSIVAITEICFQKSEALKLLPTFMLI